MKTFLLAVLFVPALSLHAAAPANRADFPLTAHVTYSASRGESLNAPQRLDVVIDGKRIELTSQGNEIGVLQLGDYPARVSPQVTPRKSWKPYDQYAGYDLLLPDGKVRTYLVTGMGTPSASGTQ